MRRPLVFVVAVVILQLSTTCWGFAVPASPPPTSLERFKRLQNQFDLRGVALASNGNGATAVTLSPIEAYFLGQAFASWVMQNQKSSSPFTIAIGRDSRLTGPALSHSLLEGIQAVCGPEAPLDLGLCTTPATFHACLDPPLGLAVAGSVMVTASHLPMDRNGMKFFFRGQGGLAEKDISEVVSLASEIYEAQHGLYPGLDLPTNRPQPWKQAHGFLSDVYGAHLARLIRNSAANGANFEQPLEGMRIVVNPGNGAGKFFLRVLEACGADTTGSINVEPDGHFPNGSPNPEDPVMMQATIDAVASSQAQLGILFDPDCDRLGLVQGSGGGGRDEHDASRAPTALNRNRLIAMAAAVVLRDHPGSTIVTDSVTSEGLSRFIARRGGKHLRYMKGYRNVIDKAMSLPDCWLAMECSGHAAFKENRFLDDGAFLAVKLIGEMACPLTASAAATTSSSTTLGALISGLEEPVEYCEIRLPVRPGQDRAVATEHVLKSFENVVSLTSWWKMEKENYEGLRARVEEDGGGRTGWLHFRASLHDPVVSLTGESEVAGGIAAMLGSLIDGGMVDATQEQVDWANCLEYMRGRRGPPTL